MKLCKLSMVLCKVVRFSLLVATLPRFFLDTRSGDDPPSNTPECEEFIALIILVEARSGVEVEETIRVSVPLG